MQPVTLNPIHDDPRLADAVAQQDLFCALHHNPAALRLIPWEPRNGRRGLIETVEMERQAVINSLSFHGIPIQVRLADLDALRDLRRDPSLTELTVRGPGRMAFAYPKDSTPDEDYTITTEWRDFPAFFANWLNHQAAEDPALGAPWSKMVKQITTDENGETSVRYREELRPGRRLFYWRTVADKAATGERDSGLVVPGSFDVFADGDETEEVPAGMPVPPTAAPRRRGER